MHSFQTVYGRQGFRYLWILVAVVLLTGFTGCRLLRMPEAEPEQQITDTGLAYTIIREGDGPAPQEGDMVSVHYTGRLSDGRVFDSSRERGEPVQFRMGSEQLLPGWEEGISLLREGARATFVIPPQLAYGDMGFGPVPENETLTFEVELLSIYTPVRLPETEIVPHKETHSGVQYSILEAGDGPRLEEDMLVSVNYTGYLDDAGQTVFDSSYERDEALTFVLGHRMVIPAWEEALPLLRVGDKVRLWVPNELAYGAKGREPIPPNTDLVFDISILDAEIPDTPVPFHTEGKDTLETDSGLRYIIVGEGEGPPPLIGNVLHVHYSGYLSDGTLFDSSVQRGEPVRFVLGTGQVLRGWDEAFTLFPKGTRARLILSPRLAYGDRAIGPIPPGETLIFDVVLIDIGR